MLKKALFFILQTPIVDLSSIPDYKFGTCDYFNGKWVLDPKYTKTAYDPSKCGVEGRWNCGVLYKQTPFGSAMKYEQYRWKPDKCEMPTLEQVRNIIYSPF